MSSYISSQCNLVYVQGSDVTQFLHQESITYLSTYRIEGVFGKAKDIYHGFLL